MAAQRGEYRKSAQRREAILDAAFKVFSQRGYVATSVSEIAREVGMTQPGLLHHFDGKLALLQAVLERRDLFALETIGARTDIDFLSALVEIARRNQRERGVVQLYAILAAEATNRSHPAHEYFERRFRMIVDGTSRAFEQARAKGLLRPGTDPHQAALESTAFAEGLQLLWLQGFDEIDLVEQTRNSINRYLAEPLPVQGSPLPVAAAL
ncbi:TetR family transcriptional regulator [Kineococcus auxinigenes]|uniref:TetR family transcriptional regulator n=1 Tax=unclassified Kineococcus TaxID=2621656 RepID=UPI003D7C62B8